jgi:predicted dienelactone hydrolase
MTDATRIRLLPLPLVVVCLAVAAGVAGAACRDGESALADERALATVRSAIDDDCPCASFDGTPGRTRADYLRCANERIDAARVQGALSAECGALASEVVRGSVCGTSGVACTSVTGSTEPEIGCRVTPATACRSAAGRRLPLPRRLAPASASSLRRPVSPFLRAVATRRACSDLEACADVVEWTAGTCVDTRADGPYAAGFREVRIAKPSAVDASRERVLDVVVWYPALPGSGPVDSASRAVRDAPLDVSGGPYPLLLFSHGSCGFPRQSLFLTPWLATHGFIVAAPPHPGNTLFEFPRCSEGGALAASFIERPQDMVATLDRMLAEDQDPESPLFGAIDETRIGMSGHSFGGLTTYLTTAIDDRFAVAMPLAAATTDTSLLEIPSLTMYGAIDSVVDNEGILAAYARSRAPKLLVGIEDAGHYAFSDGCFPSPDCNPPLTATQDEAHERVKRWVLPFLEVVLAGDRSFAPFLLAQPPPGVAVDRD